MTLREQEVQRLEAIITGLRARGSSPSKWVVKQWLMARFGRGAKKPDSVA